MKKNCCNVFWIASTARNHSVSCILHLVEFLNTFQGWLPIEHVPGMKSGCNQCKTGSTWSRKGHNWSTSQGCAKTLLATSGLLGTRLGPGTLSNSPPDPKGSTAPADTRQISKPGSTLLLTIVWIKPLLISPQSNHHFNQNCGGERDLEGHPF